MRHVRASRRAARALSSCAAALALLHTAPSRAADIQWIGTDGQWKDAFNWSLNRTPTSPDNVLLTHATQSHYTAQYVPSTVSPDSYLSPVLGSIRVEGTGLASGGMHLRLLNGYRLDATHMTVGNTGAGTVLQHNGSVKLFGDLHLARGPSATGSYTLNGGTFAAATVYVGAGGAGTFTQTGGQITLPGPFVVGETSSGSLNVSGGTLSPFFLAVANVPGVTGTVNLSGGTLNAASGSAGAAIGNLGSAVINHSGGTLNAATSFISLANAPGSSATYKLSNTGIVSTNSTVVGERGAAIITQSGGSHLVADHLLFAQQPGSYAAYYLTGGLLSSARTTLSPNSTLHQSGGTLRTGSFNHSGGDYLWSAGALEFTSALTLSSYTHLGARSTLTADHSLKVAGLTQLQVPITLDGGSFSTQSLIHSGAGAIRFRRGNLAITSGGDILTIGAGQILGPNLIVPSDSSVTLGGDANVESAAVALLDGGRFDAGDTFFNSGLVHLSTPASRLNSFTFINHPGARLITAGEISAADTLTNSGQIILSDDAAAIRSNAFTNSALLRGRGSIYANFTNAAIGEVRAEPGNTLRFLPSANPARALDPSINSGRLSLLGGSLEFATEALNNTGAGIIAGRGTLTAKLLENAGDIHLSAGLSDIFAPLNNIRGGSVIVTGNAVATFHGPLTIDERTTFNVSAGATAVFLAPVTNSGLVTGGGTKHFEAGENRVGALSTTGASVVEPAGVVFATHIREASLTVHGAVQILPGGAPASTSRLGQLTIHPGGRLDLADNDLVLDNADPAAAGALIASGLLTTTSATSISHLAAVPNRADDGSPIFTTFGGLAVDAAAVLVKYTYKGDADLDGRITIRDFFAADRGRALRLTGYQHGDFDYSSGFADAADFMLLDRSFLAQGAPLSSAAPSLPPAAHWSAPVPEPTALPALILSTLFLRRRPHGQENTTPRKQKTPPVAGFCGTM